MEELITQESQLTDTQQKLKAIVAQTVREVIREEREKSRLTFRNVAQAIWHGVTVAKAEIWKVLEL